MSCRENLLPLSVTRLAVSTISSLCAKLTVFIIQCMGVVSTFIRVK